MPLPICEDDVLLEDIVADMGRAQLRIFRALERSYPGLVTAEDLYREVYGRNPVGRRPYHSMSTRSSELNDMLEDVGLRVEAVQCRRLAPVVKPIRVGGRDL